MTLNGYLQLILYLIVLIALVKPLGWYMARVYEGQSIGLDRVLDPAVICNAIIIIFLIPLALRGVRYRPVGAATLLRNNLLIYGLGGVIAPFIGIKLIDMLLAALGLV